MQSITLAMAVELRRCAIAINDGGSPFTMTAVRLQTSPGLTQASAYGCHHYAQAGDDDRDPQPPRFIVRARGDDPNDRQAEAEPSEIRDEAAAVRDEVVPRPVALVGHIPHATDDTRSREDLRAHREPPTSLGDQRRSLDSCPRSDTSTAAREPRRRLAPVLPPEVPLSSYTKTCPIHP
jgi:hypothetical protein